MNKRRFAFATIFIVGLLMCFFSPYIFTFISSNEPSELVFCALITVFGGAGLIVDLYKNDI
jgi:hypothetical protein